MKSPSRAVPVFLVLLVATIASVSIWKSRSREPSAAGRWEAPAESPQPELISEGVAQPRRAPLPQPEPTVAEMEAQRAAQREEVRAVVDAGTSKLLQRYQSEQVDGGWAVAKAQKLKSLSSTPQIDTLGAHPTDMDVDCRSTTCHITAIFPNRVAASDWSTLYTLNVAQEMPNASLETRSNPDGTVTVEIFGLARQ